MVPKFALPIALGVVVALLFGLPPVAQSAEPAPTVITVAEMCGGCVKKINAGFKDVKGIGEVSCDIDTKSVTVTAAPGFKLSPRGLWVLMEGIGKPPTKLAGPDGVYTAKPEK